MQLFFCLLSLAAATLPKTRAGCQLGDDVIKLTSWQGDLRSPGLSRGQYPSDQHCRWVIEVSQGSRINVTFLTFDLEDGYYRNSSPSPGEAMLCNDMVKIEDAANSVLFQGCQSEGQGRTFESTGNRLTVHFISDESGEKSGFSATYTGVCQSDISESGFLESPGYPDPPPEGVECTWKVTSVQNQVLYIRPDENNTDHDLPECGSSLLNWKTDTRPKEKELCRADSKIVAQTDVTLTYQPDSSNRWIGRLFLDYNSQSGCEQYCEHGFNCFNSRSQDIGDYQCLCKPPYELGHNCEIYTDPCLAQNCSGVGLCSPVPESTNFTCHCQPGYTGDRCEELDPCDALICLNGGVCIKVNDSQAECRCPEGFEPPDCYEPPGPCHSAPCQHGGTCMRDGTGGFTCLCLSEYTGTHCSILLGEGHCRAEVDHTPGSRIRWTGTLAGHHDNQPCPDGVRGRAHRHCLPDQRSPTRGVWRRPDLSECVSPVILDLATQAQALRRTDVEGDVLYNVTRRLDNVTSELMTSAMVAVYPGDLLSACDVLSDISQGVVTARSVHHDPPGLAQYFTSSIGNILHPATFHVWSNARAHLVENKVASLLTSAQRFAENLVRRQQGVSFISGPPSSSNNTSALLSSGVDNVELLVSELGKKNVSWTPHYPLYRTSDTPLRDPAPLPPRASITLPSDLLHIARADGSDPRVKVYTGRFSTIGTLLSLKEYRYSRDDEVNVSKLVNSDVISVEVLDLPKSAFSKLNQPVVLSFPLTDSRTGERLKEYCVFMNMTASMPEERWLREGCYVYDSNETHVTCYCYHLTNFAVLLDLYDQADKLDKGNSAALSYISYIGGSLSVLACVVVIIVFEFFRLRSDRIRIHEQLAASIIAVQILFFVGVGRSETAQSTPQWGCKMVAILLHYWLTALFCWMLVEGVHIYLLLVKVFKHPSHLKKYCTIGWGVPFIVVGISVGIFFDKYGDKNIYNAVGRCWLNHEVLLVCVVPTVSLVVIINTVILILVLRVMLRSLNSTAKANTQQQSSVRTSLKASAMLLPLLGLTWILGFLAVDVGHQRVTVYVFTYLFTICNSFQGLLFFLFHCLLNVDVHNAYERRYRQRKRVLSSLETQTRKNSEASTYLADSSPNGKSTTKTILSDMSVTSGRPSLTYNRFLLFDRHLPPAMHATHPGHDPDPSAHPTLFQRRHSASFDFRGSRSYDVTCDDNFPSDVCGSAFDDVQNSDTERIWRRHSMRHDPSDTHFTTLTLHRSPSSPSTPSCDITDFVTSMHNVLDRRSKNSVRFSED